LLPFSRYSSTPLVSVGDVAVLAAVVCRVCLFPRGFRAVLLLADILRTAGPRAATWAVAADLAEVVVTSPPAVVPSLLPHL
jgi:hypothetical protein